MVGGHYHWVIWVNAFSVEVKELGGSEPELTLTPPSSQREMKPKAPGQNLASLLADSSDDSDDESTDDPHTRASKEVLRLLYVHIGGAIQCIASYGS